MKISTSLLIPSVFAAGLTFFLKPNEEIASEARSSLAQSSRPLSFCFAPGTDPEVMAEFYSSQNSGTENLAFASLGPQFALQVVDRWITTATNGSNQNSQGDPVTLTWGIVDDANTTIIASGSIATEVNSNSALRTRLAAIYGGSVTDPAENQPWFPLFEQVFTNLSALTGLTFAYEPNDDGANIANSSAPGVLGVRADIRISGHPLDGNFGVLAYNYFPDNGDMVIDTGDSFFDGTANNSLRLRNTLAHEIGHGLGLAHVCPINASKLMEPQLSTNFDGVQFDDIYSLQRNYGDSLERHSAALSNDTFANAAPIAVSSGTNFTFSPLSIDDNSDVDLYTFTAQAGDAITVTVSPSPDSYLEGSQNSDGTCSVGVTFDSSIQQDLVLALYDTNQNQVASVNAQPAGQDETMSAVIAPTSGTYFLQVSGDSANRAQLYQLEVSVTASSPSVVFNLASAIQTAENYTGQNGVADPLETVEYTFTLSNEGALDATNTTATLSGPAEFLPVEASVDLGGLASGQEIPFPLTFALDAACGETVPFTLTVTADGGVSTSFPVNATIGIEQIIFSENFDASRALPTGWQRSVVDNGSEWRISSFTFPEVDSDPNAIFATTSGMVGESILTSTQVGPLSVNSSLSFHQFYSIETGLDGGVLEMSVAGGPFTDIVAAGGLFQTGGYAQTLNDPSSTNPLNGRNAWTGNTNNQFIATEVLLPASVAGQLVQFRWRLGANNSNANNNSGFWLLDSVALSASVCDSDLLAVTLSSNDLVASEFFLEDNAELTVESILPVAVDSPVPLNVVGLATPGSDYTSLNSLLLPANSDSHTVVIDAFEDSLAEGAETFVVTSSSGGSSLSFTINDAPFGVWVTDLLGSSLQQAPSDDPDGDGLPNLEEYLFGTNPLQNDDLPQQELAFVGDDLQLTLPVATTPDDLLITPFTSPDLDVWNESTFISVEGDEYIISVPPAPYYFISLRLSLLENDAPPAP